MKPLRAIGIVLCLVLPVVLVCVLDPASTRSVRNLLSDIFGTVFWIDFPIGMCLLHCYRPQYFKNRRTGRYSLLPWVIFFFVCWGIVALSMLLETKFGTYPENGFAVVCAYRFGWLYIWFTMIPIGGVYLGFRLVRKYCRLRSEKRRQGSPKHSDHTATHNCKKA